MARILVTGGAGFIGSNLCERLLSEGHEVICLDNFYTGTKENIQHMLSHPKFTLVHHDVNYPFPHYYVDQIFHLACPASPIHYQRDPVFTSKTGVLGAMNALELARTCKARVLISSTSEIYGDPEVHPQPESYWGHVNTVGPRSCYDESKRMGETLFHTYKEMYGVDIRIIRIFNTYGPQMAVDDGRVVSNFIVQALRGEDITIYGEGKQSRSFQYVTDLIEGMLAMMRQNKTHGPVNLGNPKEFTMIQLAEKVINMTGSKSKIKFTALPKDDPRQRQPDISYAKKMLNWEPKIPLEEGLEKTIEYFAKKLAEAEQTEQTP